MHRTFSTRKWLQLFCGLTLFVFICMILLMYIVDPYLQFRITDNTYLLNPRYVNGGLIKNYDYDTLIIGSSMTQNFDMNLFRQKMGAKPLHVSIGGLSRTETLELLKLANSVNKAQNYYISIDSSTFTKSDDTASNNIPFLIDQKPFSVIRYLFSHEAWFYSIPVDICLSIVKKIGIPLPSMISQKTSIDLLGNWEADFIFDENVVIEHYKSNRFSVSALDADGIYERAQASIDQFFATLSSYEGNFHFFFPPYSALYWHSQQNQMDTLLHIKRYFVERASAYGYPVFDFQGQSFICDLNNYKDYTHYSGEINDWMVQQFVDQQCIITPENHLSFDHALKEQVSLFSERYADLIN